MSGSDLSTMEAVTGAGTHESSCDASANDLVATAMMTLGRRKLVEAGRDNVEAGVYDVDFTVRVRGKMTVGNPTFVSQQVRLPNDEMIAILMEEMGLTREQREKKIAEMMASVSAMESADRKKLVESSGLKSVKTELVRQKNLKNGKTKRRGSVRSDFQITLKQFSNELLPADEVVESSEVTSVEHRTELSAALSVLLDF